LALRFSSLSQVQGQPRRSAAALVARIALPAMWIFAPASASAQNATWVGGTPAPANSDYFAPANWTPATVPTGTATFNASANTNISFLGFSNVGGWTFSPGASAYTVTIDFFGGQLNFTGIGITVNGGSANITNDFMLHFNNSSTAGNASITNNLSLEFHNSSTAGAASITNHFSFLFYDSSTAASASISNTHAVEFFNNSTAGNAAITNVGAIANTHFEYTAGPSNDHKLSVGSIAGSGTFSLGQNELTVGSNNLSTIVDGVIVDGSYAAGGSLVKIGSGTLTLAGINSYTGGTTISGGVVQVTNNSSVGSGTVTMSGGLFQAGGFTNLTFANNFRTDNVPGGSAIDANGVNLTISGNITDGSGGPGKLTILDTSIAGGGAVILNGTNTYSGGTTICFCGTLQLGDATHSGSIVGAVTNLGVFDVVNADTSAITSINNNGGLTTFYNATSAASIAITNRNGGETAFGIALGTDTATAGSAVIVNRSGGLTVFNAATSAGSATITNRFSGETDFWDQSKAGTATIVNRFFGVTTFNNSSSAENAGITNRFGGSTFFFDQSTAGNATITNGSSGNFIGFFPPVGLGFFDDSNAGTATIINNNHGFIAFGIPFSFDTASADHANITNNAGSSLEFNGLTTAGNATITTLSGAAVAFFDGSTGGNAKFITNGTGYVDFSGSIGPGLDGRITAGSIAGSGTYYIGAGNTLTTGGNNLSTVVSGVIADFNPSPPCGCPGFPGPGSLEKVGTGTFVLSGANSYTGTTSVNGGILEVDGSIATSSLTTVNANAALTGTGTVGNTTIAASGVFMPGNGTPGSFMTVAGNLAFQSGARYLVQLDPSTSSLAKVAGTATLNGGTGAAFLTGNYVEKKYTVLTATGGVSGTFTSFDTLNLPHGFKASLSYDANNVFLDLAIGFFAPGGLNQNQQNVSNALSKFFDSTGSIPIAFGTMTSAGLTQISGESATGTQQATFDAMNLFLGLLTDPFIGGRDGGTFGGAGATPFAEETAIAYAARKSNGARDAIARFPTKADIARNNLLENRWSVWGAAYGGGSTTDGNAARGSNNATARAFGFVAGADYRISPSTLAGFALAGGGTNFSVNGLGSGRSDLFQAGAFVRHNIGAAYVTGALAYGWQDVTTDRTVTVAGIDRLRAEFNANAYSGRIEGGYRYLTPWMGMTPYAAGQFTTYSLPAYAEQVLSGANTFALNYNARDVTASRSEIGIRTDKSWAMQNAVLTLRGRLAWAHDFNTDRNITPVFQTLPGASFIVSGAAQAHDSALTTASAEMKWLNGWSAAATFEGQFSDVTRSYAGKGIVRYSW
jgi:autotransporter-associated beta strand protein